MDLHLVKDKMCHLDVFWAKSGLVATFCLPVCSPLVRLSSTNPLCPPSNPQRKPTWNMEPNEFNLWEHQLQHIHHKIVTFVFLLLLVALSISFLVCWYLLSFHVACFFSFCLLRLTLESCATNTEPNTYPKISHDLFLQVFWFQFFPHRRPGTWIVIKRERSTKRKVGSPESH